MFNLHTHTKRCRHAKGTDEEYVIRAIENGYDLIGFSDHAPHIFPNGYISNCRMLPEETEDYVNSINHLRKKYKDRIDIKLGFELEWYPEIIEKDIAFLKQFNYDYLILGQHFTDNEYENFSRYCGHKTKSIEVLEKYVNQVLEGAKSGLFTYICHPDVIHFTGDKSIFIKKMEYMASELKKLDIPLEYNFLGYFDKRHYPLLDFWKIAKEKDCSVVIGLDAHYPEVFDDKKRLNEMKAQMASLDITPMEEVKLIK